MRILISNDSPTAHYYIRMGLARVFTAAGHEVIMWDINQKSAFDAFDEFNPDLFIGQTYNVNHSIIKCIEERPLLKVIMKAGDWGPLYDKLDSNKYPLLQATGKEKLLVQELKEKTGKPNFLYIHYHEDAVDDTHGYWIKNGFDVYSQKNAADIFEFTNGKFIPEFASDIAFIGGYWGYKSQVLDKYLLPLCHEEKYNIKIFGNQHWPVYQYCGYIEPMLTKNILSSATICPNLSEPHSQDLGFDIVERPFKLLSNKCFVISDYVEKAANIFNDGEIVFAKTPEDFRKKIDHFLTNPEERNEYISRGYKKVINNHTYFDRVHEMLTRLDMDEDASKILITKQTIMEQLHL